MPRIFINEFRYRRTKGKLKGMTSVEYRTHSFSATQIYFVILVMINTIHVKKNSVQLFLYCHA